ncbi:PIH1 domain-containing 1 isoform X1 [Brachionus plicatilis]|uniref:PIH1 domain-containing protein 1 n=1 Tax=Brachionus plicatilis TaxID=10195 RepID=A0A3M7RGR8_BRAPC|nr:PIH1 domain-containing 1 isoform X1 [Brachionus plicatilis]
MSDELIKKILLNKNESNEDALNDALDNIGPDELSMLAKLYSGQESKAESKDKNYKSFLPEPGICFKTKNERTNQKIFLNICQSSEINAPKDITEQELLKIIEQENPENAAFEFRVPMSLGEAHAELDNAGAGCTAYDICISTEFLDKIQKYPTFMGFLMSIAIEGLEQKYSIKIDKNCKLLKNKKFMGQIKEQYIRIKSKPLIAEIDKNEHNEKVNRPDSHNELKSQTPKYKIYREPQQGELVEFLVAEIELPNIISANSLQLDIGEDRILLNTRSQIYHLDIYLPYCLKQEECGAQFDKKTKILTITMPVSN